jgi:hypothetical protein
METAGLTRADPRDGDGQDAMHPEIAGVGSHRDRRPFRMMRLIQACSVTCRSPIWVASAGARDPAISIRQPQLPHRTSNMSGFH